MLSTKPRVFKFEDADKDESICVTIPEVLDVNYGMYVWACAPVLGQYIWHHRASVKDKMVLELGAGTALAGIVAAKIGAKKVILSDAAHLPQCVKNCGESAQANGLEDSIAIARISWGEFGPDLLNLEPVDIILGSDCFYDPKDFEDLLVTVSYLLACNEKAEFWTTYQVRSEDWNVHHLMMKWGLKGRKIPLDTFEADTDSICGSGLPGRHEIHLYVITKSQA